MNLFISTIRTASRICGVFAAFLIAASVAVVCQMVVLRYFLNQSTVWQTDFVTYALVGATFIGAPYVAQIKGHVNVDLLPMYASHRWRMVLAYLAVFAALAFSGILAWTGWELWYEAFDGSWLSDSVWELPLAIPYIAMPIGLTLMALEYLADTLCLVRGDEVPFGTEPGGHP